MTRQELYEKTVKIIRDCVPELADAEITEASVVNTDMGMDSMNFILVICKLDAEFGVKIPNKLWKKLSTLGDVLDALQKYGA